MGKDDEHCKGCASFTEGGCASQECTEERSLAGSLNDVKNVIAVMSGKGGVGKSSIAGMLATALSRDGFSVGVLDADITGPSIPRAFGIQGGKLQGTPFGLIPPESQGGIKVMSINLLLPNEDDPVIWRGPVISGAVKQFWDEVDWRELDYMVVDMPPGTGDVPLTVLQSLPVTGLVIVFSPQDLVMMVVKKTIKMAQKMNVPILGLVENMSYAVWSHCGERLDIFGKSTAQEAAKEMGIPLLAQLPWDPQLNRLMDEGRIEDCDEKLLTALIGNLKKQFGKLHN